MTSYQKLKLRFEKAEKERAELRADVMEIVHRPWSEEGKEAFEKYQKQLYFGNFSNHVIENRRPMGMLLL